MADLQAPVQPPPVDLGKVEAILARHGRSKAALVHILQDVQAELRYLPREAVALVSKSIGVPFSKAFAVATFYKAFSLVPKGKHSISVCLGTACHVRGAPRLLDRVVETFKVRPGGTSADMRFSLDTVNCLGCCALGPVMVVDGQYYSNSSKEELVQLAAAD